MKKIIRSVIVLFIISCSSNNIEKNALVTFEEIDYNFGYINLKNEAEHVFNFNNIGKSPIIISEVETSCGCTGVDWTKKPVKPGKEGHVIIKYDAAFPGTFEKTIKVHYNGKDSPVLLKIRGKVAYPEDMEDLAE